MALNDAAPLYLYRGAPEARQARASGGPIVRDFLREMLPRASDAARKLTGDLIMTTLGKVGKHVSETCRTAAEVEAYADALADMLSAYLESLGRR